MYKFTKKKFEAFTFLFYISFPLEYTSYDSQKHFKSSWKQIIWTSFKKINETCYHSFSPPCMQNFLYFRSHSHKTTASFDNTYIAIN